MYVIISKSSIIMYQYYKMTIYELQKILMDHPKITVDQWLRNYGLEDI